MRWLALFLFALPLFAQSELCRFRAGDDADPFRRWLTSQEVTCFDASSASALPAGKWNVFERTANAVSLPVFVGDGKSVDLSTMPAALLKATLPAGHTGVVYLPQLAVAYPLINDQALVPANQELWVLVLERSQIASLVPVTAIDAGSERAIDARTGGVPPSAIG